MLLGELPGLVLVLPLVRPVDNGDPDVEGAVRVGVGEEGADGEEQRTHGDGRAPLLHLQDVQADGAVPGGDVRVVDLGGEPDLGWGEGVVSGEGQFEAEDPFGVGRVLGAGDGGVPVEEVVVPGRAGGTVGWRVGPHLH